MPNAFSTLERIKKISNQRNAHCDEIDELRTDISERSMQSVQDTHQESLIREDILEKFSNLQDFSLLPKGRIEENVSD